VVQLNPIKRKRTQIQKRPVSLFILGILLLSVVLLANSSSGAPTAFRNTTGARMKALVSLPESGEFESEKNLAQGKFLVASRKLKDPNFYQTVILLIRYGQDGASGLVINRPLNMKLSSVMPEIKELEQRKENLYLGGPVEPGRVLLLLKSAAAPEDSIPVFGDVYISSSRKELKRLIKSTNKSEKFRIYAGYAGWAPRQLESERDRGDWHVLKADTETLFDKKSLEIWQELIHRFSANWVHLKIPDRSGVQRFKLKRLQDQVRLKLLNQRQ
jgi:putative transcriptional regulator